jgi:adenylate cyclase
LRIASQLIDAATGASLAANRFEGTLDDVFELQDRVAEGVVAGIAPKLEHAEIVRAQRKTESLDAYDHFLRGMASYYHHQWSREKTDQALQSFRRATELDPHLGMAYAMAAMGHFRRKSFGWFTDQQEEEAEVARLARSAVQSSGDDAAVLGLAGLAIAFVSRELDVGAGYAGRAVSLNPNLASTQYASGWIKNWLGEPEAAVDHFALAMRLSPVDPSLAIMQAGTAHAYFFVDRNEEASRWADMALAEGRDRLTPLRIGVASHAHAGHEEKARQLAARLRQFYPAFRLSSFRDAIGPYRRREQMAKYEDALRQAGLPE